MHEIFCLLRTCISEDLPTPSEESLGFRKTSEGQQRFLTTSEDSLTTSKYNRRCRKIFDDFKTRPANDFQRISNQSRALLKSSKDAVMTSQPFLSNYTCYCHLGVRNWSECVRSQSTGARLAYNA